MSESDIARLTPEVLDALEDDARRPGFVGPRAETQSLIAEVRAARESTPALTEALGNAEAIRKIRTELDNDRSQWVDDDGDWWVQTDVIRAALPDRTAPASEVAPTNAEVRLDLVLENVRDLMRGMERPWHPQQSIAYGFLMRAVLDHIDADRIEAGA